MEHENLEQLFSRWQILKQIKNATSAALAAVNTEEQQLKEKIQKLVDAKYKNKWLSHRGKYFTTLFYVTDALICNSGEVELHGYSLCPEDNTQDKACITLIKNWLLPKAVLEYKEAVINEDVKYLFDALEGIIKQNHNNRDSKDIRLNPIKIL